MLVAQRFLDLFAFGDIGVGTDETGDAAVVIKRLVLDKQGASILSGMVGAARLELRGELGSHAHMFFNVAWPVISAYGNDADDVLEACTAVHGLHRETKHLGKVPVP